MNSRSRALLALVFAATMIAAAPGSTSASVTSVDTSTTDDTSSVSQIQLTTTLTLRGNASDSHIYQVISGNSTSDPETEVENNATGRVFVTNASATKITTAADNSEGSHWNFTFSEGELKDVEHTLNENVTVTFVAKNNSSTTVRDVETTIGLNFTDNSTVELVTDSEVDSAELDNKSGSFRQKNESAGILDIGLGREDQSDIKVEDRSVNGSDSTVVIVFANSSVDDDFTDPASDASAEDKLSTGLLTWSQKNVVLLTLDGSTFTVPVFYKEAPTGWDTDTRTPSTRRNTEAHRPSS